MLLTFLFIFCWVQRGRVLARSGDVLAASAVVLPVHYSILLLVAFASLFDVIYWAIDNQLLNVGQPYVYADRKEREEREEREAKEGHWCYHTSIQKRASAGSPCIAISSP